MFCSEVFLDTAQIVGVADRGPGEWNYVLRDGTIFVHNLSYNKEVGFHLRADGRWVNLYASYSRSLLTGEGRTLEAWHYSGGNEAGFASDDLTHPLKTFQFAVFYHNLDWGTWYWDNNFSQDYFLTALEG